MIGQNRTTHPAGRAATDLRDLEAGRRVRPPAAFAVAAQVWHAVRRVGDQLCVGVWLCCPMCRQGIVETSFGGKPYGVPQDQFESQVLAHLIQRHDWTRETVGDVT